MAVRPVTVIVEENRIIATWTGLNDGDTGQPVDFGKYDKCAAQCTAGTIGTSSMQGSNDNVTWGALGAGITIPASNGVVDVTPIALFLRPSVGTGGSGATVIAIASR